MCFVSRMTTFSPTITLERVLGTLWLLRLDVAVVRWCCENAVILTWLWVYWGHHTNWCIFNTDLVGVMVDRIAIALLAAQNWMEELILEQLAWWFVIALCACYCVGKLIKIWRHLVSIASFSGQILHNVLLNFFLEMKLVKNAIFLLILETSTECCHIILVRLLTRVESFDNMILWFLLLDRFLFAVLCIGTQHVKHPWLQVVYLHGFWSWWCWVDVW